MLRLGILASATWALLASQLATGDQSKQPALAAMPDTTGTASTATTKSALVGRDIIERAHQAAGGDTFVHPQSLFLSGHNIFYDDTGGSRLWDQYAMWRVFAGEKSAAHAANGKVRIEAWRDGKLAMLLSFDGQSTYNQYGRMEDQTANTMWRSNFGFGAIRNALDTGWSQQRRANRSIDGKPAYMVQLTDPDGGATLFGFHRDTYEILYVGFNTPRGWHERRYSDYFSKPGVNWQQAGRVRLYYDGVLANEAIWTDFEIGKSFDDDVFVVSDTPVTPSFD